MKVGKVRLDLLLVNRGLFESREGARRAVMAGLVSRNGEVLDKPGMQVPADLQVDVRMPEHAFVSRGGLKLERALTQFGFSLMDKVVLDVGASTGGFTDCALQHGAKQVYAVDVGYGQLAWKLRNDIRVTVMERVNFRHVESHLFEPRPTATVMDVSFISTRLLLPKIQEVMGGRGDVISLIKPQFEAGKSNVGKGGIVRNPDVHMDVLNQMLEFVYSIGMSCRGLDYSPITGGDGNIEFLGWWSAENEELPLSVWKEKVPDVVDAAWQSLRSAE